MASESLGNASKTSALSEELVEVEKNTQNLKQVYTQALKRVEELLVAAPAVTDVEKRLRKQATYVLGTTLQDNMESGEEQTNETLYNLLQSCGECQVLIAKQSVRFELQLQETVLNPMTEILQSIKELEMLKRKLNHARLDMDMARKRSSQSTKADPQLVADAETAHNQFNMSQDTYITALLSFTSKESEHIRPLHNLLTCQQQMYSDVSKLLSTRLPSIQNSMEKTAMFPVFGTDLEKHLEHTGKPIAIVLQKCCHSLLKCGIESPGIFRLAGSLSQLRKLKAMFDSNRMDEDAWEQDVFTLAQAIKLYLRELPDPLLTFPMFSKWCDCINMKDMTKRVKRCKELIDILPTANQTNLQYLMWFLKKTADMEKVNKMGASNLGLVLGPNILRSEEEKEGENLTALNSASALTRLMIVEYDTLFPNPLPADLTNLSLPRTATMSVAGIRPDRPSIKSHKKGKAPTPKKAGPPPPPNARVDLPSPAPPPRVDLDLTNKNTPPKPSPKPTTPSRPDPPASEATNPFNPFGASDEEEEEPVPPVRTSVLSDPVTPPKPNPVTTPVSSPLLAHHKTPSASPKASPKLPIKPKVKESNPFGDDEESPSLIKENNFNPFAESDEETPEVEEEVIPAIKPNRKSIRPSPISQQLSETVSFDRPESPSFAVTTTPTKSPCHSRNPSLGHTRTPSNTSVNSLGGSTNNLAEKSSPSSPKSHSRNLSSSSTDKPVPPPRPSFDK